MDINRALALAAAAGDVELGRMYATAVARGGSNADCTAEEDHVCGMARLVTLALIRASNLALSARLLDMIDENDQDPLVARAASDASAGTLRLAHRAVEMHSRDVGYETGVWIERALLHAAAELEWRANGRGRGRAGGAGRGAVSNDGDRAGQRSGRQRLHGRAGAAGRGAGTSSGSTHSRRRRADDRLPV